MKLYRLDGRLPVPIPGNDPIKWAHWFETADRRVATTDVGPYHVSTVFLGLDHAFFGGPPKLFETMVFTAGETQWQERCSTWAEAEAMHARVVNHYRELLPQGVKHE
jgi:hypothetical protein